MNNTKRALFLITEESFHPTYLIVDWLLASSGSPEFRGILIRGQHSEEKDRVHRSLASKTLSNEDKIQLLRGVYGRISDAEQEMIDLKGFPKPFDSFNSSIKYIGYDINALSIQSWVEQQTGYYDEITFFIFLDVIMAPWWLSNDKVSVINAHSAVLPFARGMNAIENMAYLGDSYKFQEAAGASIHYIDHNIDTGPLIQTARLNNSLSYHSIGQVKAASYFAAFDLLISHAKLMARNTHLSFVGITPNHTGPLFLQKNYTAEVESRAKKNYLKMKQEHSNKAALRQNLTIKK
ncbi:phosphoribosylglycinamide formyltransferase-1 [Paenibacillus forsythiae]|uniref:Phosphoribosylglycinamide formyltransferase-1 n=1 Tax=Paenibacillus forsythiae TaxID=365616 RepID=A0ABU3H9P8_9BACL|nr:formyltransferase family protein [Paenibacillus forsythiae]MDT3427541.1 phosphoribosylglycinamide formyltransferase-1 [Paenibacillus forsythiae]